MISTIDIPGWLWAILLLVLGFFVLYKFNFIQFGNFKVSKKAVEDSKIHNENIKGSSVIGTMSGGKVVNNINNYNNSSGQSGNVQVSKQNFVKVSTDKIKVGKEKGFVSIDIESNTDWSIVTNNTINQNTLQIEEIKPLNGSGNATVTVKYKGVRTQNYQQSITLHVCFLSFNTKQLVPVRIYRKS